MQLLSTVLPPDHDIVLASDLHIGTKAHHSKGWSNLIKKIKEEENIYLALGGDMIESIMVDDPRWSSDVHDSKFTPYEQMEYVKSDLMLIKDKILFILDGNHELKLAKFGELTRIMCEGSKVVRELKGIVSNNPLGVPYGGYSTKLHVFTKHNKRRKSLYKMFYTHGRLTVGSSADDPIRRRSNMAIKIKRKLAPLAGDCAIMATGHCHALQAVKPMHELYMGDDGQQQVVAKYTKAQQRGDYIPPNLRWYVSTGSFLKTFITGATSYSEMAMYPPHDLGYAKVIVRKGEVQEVKEVFIGTA